MTALIEVRDLHKRFAKNDRWVPAIDRVDLQITDGSFTTVAGPSGCGKSTLLNIIAGLLAPTQGSVFFRGEPVDGPLTDVGYLTQKDTLMPWRNIESNVAMPLEVQGVDKSTRLDRARELLDLVGLSHFEHHYPGELSGGMLRRACLARMLCGDPDVFLMDEPFGALDAQLRIQLQTELLRLWSDSGQTVVFVTHDIEESIVLGDRVIVLGVPGRVVHTEDVSLPRPRDPAEVRFLPEYQQIHERLWHVIVGASDRDREPTGVGTDEDG